MHYLPFGTSKIFWETLQSLTHFTKSSVKYCPTHRAKLKKNACFRVTRPYLKILVNPITYFRVSGFFLCFLKSKMPSKCIKLYFFQKKICVPNIPKIFRIVTQNTLIFSFGLIILRYSLLFQAENKNKQSTEESR